MAYLSIAALFVLTALAEIFGCYLVYLWWQHNGALWLLIPAALSLAAFAWLLTFHPAASGRIYAAYAGVYLVTALAWLGLVDGESLKRTDWLGGGLALLGALIIASGWE